MITLDPVLRDASNVPKLSNSRGTTDLGAGVPAAFTGCIRVRAGPVPLLIIAAVTAREQVPESPWERQRKMSGNRKGVRMFLLAVL